MIALRSSLLLALFALSAKVLATPPACLLAAVKYVRRSFFQLQSALILDCSTQENPADLGTICGDEASNVQEVIATICDDNADAAQSAFSSTCAGAGKTVGAYALVVSL